MRVVIDGIIWSLQPKGGVSKYFSELLPRVADSPDTIHVDLFLHGKAPAMVRSQRWICVHKWPRLPRFGWGPFRRIDQRLAPFRTRLEDYLCSFPMRRIGPAVFHSTYYTLPPDRRMPQVVTVYDMIYEKFPELFSGLADDGFRTFKERCIRSAARVIAISETTKRDVCEFYKIPEERVDTVYLGGNDHFPPQVNDDTVRQVQARYMLNAPFMLYVGARYHYKNFRRVVEAFAKNRLAQDIELVAVGAPCTSAEKEMLNSLGVTNRVHFIEFPNDHELAALYAAANIFIYPSLYEGFGLPLLEAMACGTPVAAAKAGSIPEIAGNAAIYFDPYQTESIAQAVRQLLDQSVAAQYRTRGRLRVQNFSWDETARNTCQVYRNVLAGASR